MNIIPKTKVPTAKRERKQPATSFAESTRVSNPFGPSEFQATEQKPVRHHPHSLTVNKRTVRKPAGKSFFLYSFKSTPLPKPRAYLGHLKEDQYVFLLVISPSALQLYMAFEHTERKDQLYSSLCLISFSQPFFKIAGGLRSKIWTNL